MFIHVKNIHSHLQRLEHSHCPRSTTALEKYAAQEATCGRCEQGGQANVVCQCDLNHIGVKPTRVSLVGLLSGQWLKVKAGQSHYLREENTISQTIK